MIEVKRTGYSERWEVNGRQLLAEQVKGQSTKGVQGNGWRLWIDGVLVAITHYPKNTYIAYNGQHPRFCDNPIPQLAADWSAWKTIYTNQEWERNKEVILSQVSKHLLTLDCSGDGLEGWGENNDWHPGHPSNFGDN